MQRGAGFALYHACDVSILTRPGGRVQRPSPRPSHTDAGFNPHPSRRTGATKQARGDYTPLTVSILTRPGGRVQLQPNADAGRHHTVSILTRPGGRVQPGTYNLGVAQIVSILTRPGGRVQRRQLSLEEIENAVSILTRPGGRVQQPPSCPQTRYRKSFNPHPSRRTGATSSGLMSKDFASVSILTRPGGRVQHAVLPLRCYLGLCFNPHPSRRTGATAYLHQYPLRHEPVSILTRPGGRVQRRRWTASNPAR